ncbi:MAG: ATP-binding protein [Succinivibrio sp.]|nr:ATP-binding protein [Succinivibrio sp.]MDY6262348.1 ATP-binding protein [Succinivibrio sp.]
MKTKNNMEQTIILPQQRGLLDKLSDLKLDGFNNELAEQYENIQLYQDMTFEERLERCLDAQIEFAGNNRFRRLVQNSKIRNKIYIRQFIPSPSRGLTSETLLKLKDGDFLNKGLNIVISGPTGTGKTALASATAIEAMSKGYSAMFFRMNELMVLIEAKDKPALARFIDKLRRIRLVIIDDYGLTKISDSVVAGLNEIADARYGIGSTIITSQLKKKALKSVIDESPIRDALADRLFRDCDWEITLKGNSWRGSADELSGEKIK